MTPVLAALAAGLVVLLAHPVAARSPDLRAVSVLLGAFVATGVVVLGIGLGPRLPLAGIGAATAWAVYRQVRLAQRRRQADRRADVVIEICEGLAADLRAGQPPISGLQAAARAWPEFRPVADAAELGGDVAQAMRRLAELPGCRGLRAVAAAWVIAHRSGAGLAEAVALAARAIREERATTRVVETEMASARATARLLAALPVGVLLLGRGAGGDPFAFLFGSPAGLVCLGLGLGLAWAGLSWLERIARSVQG